MAAATVNSFLLDKENDVGGSQLSTRTPHSAKGIRMNSGSTLDGPLKPGQRSLSNSTPNFNRTALQNVKNTPLKGGALQGGTPTFKTPIVVRPKLKQSPAVDAADPMTRNTDALPLEDEDFVGEFVAPKDRVSTYFDTLIKCNPLAFWGFPCIPFTGSTSDDEDEEDKTHWSRSNRRHTDLPVHPMRIEDREMQLTENLIEHREPITDDLLPIEHREPFTDDLRPHTEFYDIPVGQNLQTSRPGVTAL